MASRIHISHVPAFGTIFSNAGIGRGKDGDVKKGSWLGKSIVIKGRDSTGKIRQENVNAGSLIDLINAHLPKNQRLKKGCFFGLIGRTPDKKILEAFYREFPLNKTTPPLHSFYNKNNAKINCYAVKNKTHFSKDIEVFVKAYPGFDKQKLKHFDNGLQYLDYFFNERVQENINDQRGQYIRAYDGDKLIGGVYYDLNWNQDKPLGKQTIYVDQIFIDPEYQKSGIGKELLFSIFKDKAIASRYNSITVLVEHHADNARGFYEKLGFKPVDPQLIPFFVRGGTLYKLMNS